MAQPASHRDGSWVGVLMGLGEFLRDALDGVELDDELAEELDPEVCKGHLCDCNRCTERRAATNALLKRHDQFNRAAGAAIRKRGY